MAWRAGLLLLLTAGVAGASDDGEYLFHIAGCLSCHTVEDGPPLAGGRSFETAFGTFYAPNITPDPDTGIGGWSRDMFVAALKHGEAPDGGSYFPVFPYPSYRLMSDADAGAIFDYLQTVKPVIRPNREHALPWWFARWMMKPWQWWLLEEPPPPGNDPATARGRYLVRALGHCGECHTRRKFAGVTDQSQHLAGTVAGPEGDKVPNITPHRDDGIGKWDADDLDWFLESGELPNGDYTGGLMVDVVDHATSKLTRADRRAMVDYLRSIRPLPGP